MAFLLLATALYFAWPFLDRVISVRTFWWLLFGVIAVGALFMIVRTRQMLRSPRAVTIAAALAVVVTAPALYATVQLTRHPYTWQPYSDAALADAVAQHKPVLVDFTATWCGNCHWLEAFVLNKSAVADAVRRHDVLMLKADVTQDDASGRELLGPFADVLTRSTPLDPSRAESLFGWRATGPSLLEDIRSGSYG